MRDPRYRFSDETRSVTREMASRMVDDGTVAQTPEQLEAWIGSHPDAKETLERDGYGVDFTAHDLFPLFEAMVTKAGGRVAPVVLAAEPSARPSRTWLLAGVLLLLFVLLVWGLVTDASSQTM